jgi:transcriptional regulator with XRE-family HTH domain
MVTQDIGGRVAELRRRRGLTQQQLAEAIPLSYSYISLIEAGKRTPRRLVLALLAERLGCSAEYLETGRGADRVRALDLELRFAELALRSGDAPSAQGQFEVVLAEARRHGDAYNAEAVRALWGLGRCALALGHMDVAAQACEAVAEADQLPDGLTRPAVLLAVCRSYLECGDVNHAIEVGEDALREARADGTFDQEDLAELQATVATCYYERGDFTRAQRLVDEVLDVADATGSLRARGAGLWDAAVLAEARGDLLGAERMTEAALAAYAEAERAVATAVVTANAAALLLRVGRTSLDVVEQRLTDAIARLRSVNAPLSLTMEATGELARCRLCRGDAEGAAAIAAAAVAELRDGAPFVAARLRAILAEARLALHPDDEAVAETVRAADALLASGRLQRVRCEVVALAEAVYRVGRPDEAIAIYRRVSAPWAHAASVHAKVTAVSCLVPPRDSDCGATPDRSPRCSVTAT